MTESLGRAELELATNQSGLDSGLKQAEGKSLGFLGKVRDSFSRLSGSTMGGALLQGVGLGAGLSAFGAIQAGIGKTVQVFGDAITAASDLSETTSKVTVVFGDQAAKVLEMGENAATAMGMSKNAALAAAGTYGNLFRAMGMTEEASADMSVGLVQLASDLASFNNMDPTEVMDKLRAGLSGETEPLKALGVNLSQARIEAEAMAMGLEKVDGALTPAAKAQATYSLILKDTTLAQGDYARTADGLANTQRTLDAELENASAELGEALLPIWLELTRFFKNVGIPILHLLIGAFKLVLDVIGFVVNAVGALVDAVASGFNDMALNFGEMGDEVHRIADETGQDFQLVKDAVKDGMEDAGLSFEEAAERAEIAMRAIRDGTAENLEEALTIADREMGRLPEIARDATGGFKDEVYDNLLAAKGVVSQAAGEVADTIPEELEEAKDAAVEIAKATPAAIAGGLLLGVDELEEEWDAFLESLEDRMTGAAAKLALEAKLASPAIREGLTSDNPETVADTVDLVEQLLASYEALEPGASDSGYATSGKYRTGILANLKTLPAAVSFLEERLGAELDLSGPAYTWGTRLGASFLAGMTSYYWRIRQASIELGEAAAVGIRLRSPAKEGALSEPADLWGARLVSMFVDGILSNADRAGAASLTVARRAAAALSNPLGQVGALQVAAGALGAGGGLAGVAFEGGREVHVHEHYELTYNGTPRDFANRADFIRELDAMSAFGDGRLG